MTLSVILARKGHDVVTTSPDETMRGIAQILSDKGIGAILVTGPDKTLLGIVSERDIVRAIARGGAGALDEPVSSHMTARVKTGTGETSISEAMGVMTEGRFRHIPVMDSGRVDGLVSIGDLVKYRLSEMEHENKALFEYITAA